MKSFRLRIMRGPVATIGLLSVGGLYGDTKLPAPESTPDALVQAALASELDGPSEVREQMLRAALKRDFGEAYNLVVSDFDTYFVGQQRLLVHDNLPLEETAVVVPGLRPQADVVAEVESPIDTPDAKAEKKQTPEVR